MAWDAVNGRLVIAGGWIDTRETPNRTAYYPPFANGAAGHWTEDADASGCFAGAKPAARMALDTPTGKKVLFGGIANTPNGAAVVYGDTTVCD